MIRTIVGLILGFLFTCPQLKGQNIDFSAKYFPNRIHELETALSEIDKGDSLFYKNKDGSDQEALTHFLAAQNFNSENAFLNYKIGACYLNSAFKEKALPFLTKALKYDIGVNPDLMYLLAQAYHHSERFDSALICYDIFKTRFLKEYTSGMLPAELSFFNEELNLNLNYSINAREICSNPIIAEIQNIGPTINTSNPEYNPKISADNNLLVFTSRRPNTTGGGKLKLDEKYFEDIYISIKKNGEWTSPVNVGRPVNTELNDGVIALSVDGQTLLTDYGGISGDIYESKLYGSRWSRPEKLPKVINSEEIESSACWSADGMRIYFTSDRAGGYGGGDIYVAKVNMDGSLGHPENLGPKINTKFNEESVFIHPDGKTLYFSSEGHNSIGGYDIFKSTLKNDQWSEAVNLGYPVNTVDDDVFFTITADGKTAFYSSERTTGFGGQDIYMISFNKTDEKVTEPLAMKFLSGRVLDAVQLQAVGARIEVYDISSGKPAFITSSNSSSGKFSFSLEPGKKYGITFSVPGYLFHSVNVDLSSLDSYESSLKNVFLYKIRNTEYPEQELQKALRGNCFEVVVDEEAKLLIDPANGKITKGKEIFVQRNVEKVLQRNRDRLVLLFDAGIDMEDIIDLVCQEIINTVADDSTNMAIPAKTELSGLVENEMKNFRISTELDLTENQHKTNKQTIPNSSKGKFDIDLLQLSGDAINDTTGELESLPELEQSIHQNFLNIVIDNKFIISNSLKQNTAPSEIMQQLIKEICEAGGLPISNQGALRSKSVASYLREALSVIYPEIYHKPVFDIPLPSSYFDISSKNAAVITKETEDTLINKINRIALENNVRFELLFASGKSLPEIQKSFYTDLTESIKSGNEILPATIEEKLKMISNIAVENIFLDLNMIHVLNNSKVSGKNIALQSDKIKMLVSSGITYSQITKMLSRGSLMPENCSSPQIFSDSDIQIESERTKRILEENLPAIMPDNNIFNVNVYETTLDAIDDADGSFNEKDQEYIALDIDKIIDDNKDLIIALLSIGNTYTQIESTLAEQIARKSGAVDEKNKGNSSPKLLELIHKRLATKMIGQNISLFGMPVSTHLKTLLHNYSAGIQDSAGLLNEFKKIFLMNQSIISAIIKTGVPISNLQEKFLEEIISNSGSRLAADPLLKSISRQAFNNLLNTNLVIPQKFVASIILNNIFFEYDQIALKSESANELGKLLDLLNQNPKIRIEISGHSDNIGSDEYNMELSLRRARSVESYLIKKGIAAGRLLAKGYGKTRPIAPNKLSNGEDNPEGRAMNRRTEFIIIAEK